MALTWAGGSIAAIAGWKFTTWDSLGLQTPAKLPQIPSCQDFS